VIFVNIQEEIKSLEKTISNLTDMLNTEVKKKDLLTELFQLYNEPNKVNIQSNINEKKTRGRKKNTQKTNQKTKRVRTTSTKEFVVTKSSVLQDKIIAYLITKDNAIMESSMILDGCEVYDKQGRLDAFNVLLRLARSNILKTYKYSSHRVKSYNINEVFLEKLKELSQETGSVHRLRQDYKWLLNNPNATIELR
jgi:hypothetical protein